MSVSRREFLGAMAASTAIGAEIDKSKGLPARILGRTGARVSILAFGCGSRFQMYKDAEGSIEALNRGLDKGITYIDTAQGYGNGESEKRVGEVMKTRRQGIFLSTKTHRRKRDEALQAFEESLKRLQTDHVDLLHIHSLGDDEDLAAIEAKDGVLNALYKLRDQKAVRFIGITSHTYPSTLKKALERHDFDCTQMALNAALIGMMSGRGGMVPNPALKESFESVALPVANRKKLGVIAMKIYAQEKLSGQAPAEKLLGYCLSLPVSAAVVGMPTLEYLDSNLEIARNFKPMSKRDMRDLSQKLSGANKTAHDRFFIHHVDA
jgi:aryl-alcohol dehydrogenase-like predicted oxidoreductase